MIERWIDRPAATCGQIDHEHQIRVERGGRRQRKVSTAVHLKRHGIRPDFDAESMPSCRQHPLTDEVLMGLARVAFQDRPVPIPVVQSACVSIGQSMPCCSITSISKT